MDRKPPLPAISSANPGQGTSIRVGFSNALRGWAVEADTLATLAVVLEKRGMKFRRGETYLELENGLIARPQFVRLQPQDDESVNTITTIEINHPVLCPRGTFEYQHAVGGTLDDSLQKGFIKWADSDLPVFIDAIQEKFVTCTWLLLDVARRRQVVFGPPVHGANRDVFDAGEAHNFCPCCLFTNALDAFRDQIQGDEFHGIRLFATRDAKGAALADCRINGIDWPPGVAALLKYIATWPDRGLEYRKQFVAIRTLRPDQ